MLQGFNIMWRKRMREKENEGNAIEKEVNQQTKKDKVLNRRKTIRKAPKMSTVRQMALFVYRSVKPGTIIFLYYTVH